ncbi:MAG: prepilin-type N-terminal cleavage/methylation domain-containing protein, partial [Planctomycetes bacterium]|nr:prepilin-type N-terminal cleavage/methylation domain-containing protein [Planctomycetota bacterium]
RGGFTLIELLVVVTIITLLLAILLPSLSRSLAHAKTTVCQTRMRQLMLASVTYSSDWFGTMPHPDWDSWEPYPGWLYDKNDASKPRPQSGVLFPLVKDVTLYHCPSHPQPWTYGTQVYTSYTMNGSVCGYGNAGKAYALGDFQATDVIFWETHEESTYWNDGSNFPHEFATGRHPLSGDVGAGNVVRIDTSTKWLSTDEYHELAFPSFPASRNELWNRPYSSKGW